MGSVSEEQTPLTLKIIGDNYGKKIQQL